MNYNNGLDFGWTGCRVDFRRFPELDPVAGSFSCYADSCALEEFLSSTLWTNSVLYIHDIRRGSRVYNSNNKPVDFGNKKWKRK